MIIPIIVWWLVNSAMKEIDRASVSWSEDDLFLMMMNQTGKSICDYGYQEVPKLMSFEHYFSTVPASDRETITWDKYRYIVMYLNDFEKKHSYDVSTMESHFCEGWSGQKIENTFHIVSEYSSDQMDTQLLNKEAA